MRERLANYIPALFSGAKVTVNRKLTVSAMTPTSERTKLGLSRCLCA